MPVVKIYFFVNSVVFSSRSAYHQHGMALPQLNYITKIKEET